MTFLKILLDILGTGAIVVFGAFVLVLIADLILSSIDNHEGIFFNKGRKEEKAAEPAPVQEEVYNPGEEPTPAPEDEVYNPEEEGVAIDYDQAIREQQELQSKMAEEEPEEEDFVEEEDDLDELKGILSDVTAKALAQLDDESKQKTRKVFTVKVKQPAPEPEPEPEEVVDEEKLQLEQKIKELEEQRAKDREELERMQEEMRKQETVVVESEDDRKYANIARMNARLNRIKRNTEKLANQKQPQTEVVVTEEVVVTKPRFQREYYVERLAKLEGELKDANRELRQINKEYMPVVRVKKVYDRDINKLRRKEAIVAKQKVAIYGVNKSGNVDEKKKAKLDANVAELKELKDSIFHCEQVIEQNKDRFPVLEKNHKLVLKEIKRINDDIQSTKESIEWYDNNTETVVTTTTTSDDGTTTDTTSNDEE